MIIGITGGTGAGKTSALRVLSELGFFIMDCDAVYHGLLRTSERLLTALDERFPGVVVDGALDRKALGRHVFGDEAALSDLSALTHPFVIEECERLMAEERSRGREHMAIDAIALFESGADKLCDATVFVTAPREIRARRIMAREGIDESYALLRIDAQKPDSFFEERCTLKLVNDFASEAEFADHCREVFGKMLEGK